MDISTLTLSYPSITAELGRAITDVRPAWTPALDAPTSVSYKITEGADPLPTGLELVPETGVIRGTPTEVASEQSYSITVTGLGSLHGHTRCSGNYFCYHQS